MVTLLSFWMEIASEVLRMNWKNSINSNGITCRSHEFATNIILLRFSLLVYSFLVSKTNGHIRMFVMSQECYQQNSRCPRDSDDSFHTYRWEMFCVCHLASSHSHFDSNSPLFIWCVCHDCMERVTSVNPYMESVANRSTHTMPFSILVPFLGSKEWNFYLV